MPNREKKTKSITIRITDSEYNIIETLANEEERTISDTIRRIIVKYIKEKEKNG